ncbi:hypothetical protein D4764_19G0006270 [Takifugu flavidus]|uniref:Uncharacterized protein n=1 Tax=Takifugu flavidus TaxID=433684 RepID=A0A5C6NQB2_9TELE|nr:hypothetical protein D4764_19G0006270 [Takifugu flavidus]
MEFMKVRRKSSVNLLFLCPPQPQVSHPDHR